MAWFRLLVSGTAAAGAALLVLAACGGDDPGKSDEAIDAATDVERDSSSPESLDASADATQERVDLSNEPVVCDAAPCAVELAAGTGHFCARMSDGKVRCWGNDNRGALGRGESEAGPGDTGTPAEVVGLTGVTQISAAGSTTCAVTTDGVVRCWGSNQSGLLGLAVSPVSDDSQRHPTPEPMAVAGPFSRVDVGLGTACALTASGEATCWGYNATQQIPRTDAGIPRSGPGRADLLVDPIAQYGGTDLTSFGLTVDGGLLSWGRVGDDSLSGRESSLRDDRNPARIQTLSGVTSFAVGVTHACAIREGGRVACWGKSSVGALCTGLPDGEPLPAPATQIDAPLYPQRLAASRANTCVRITNGTIRCCGDDQKGQIGTGTVGTASVSLTIASAFKGYAVQVAVVDGTTCALLRGGTVECWGGNEHGALGRGGKDSEPHPIPAPVAF